MRQFRNQSRRSRCRLGNSEWIKLLDSSQFLGIRLGYEWLHPHPARSQQVQNRETSGCYPVCRLKNGLRPYTTLHTISICYYWPVSLPGFILLNIVMNNFVV